MNRGSPEAAESVTLIRTPRAVVALCFVTLVLEGYDLLMFGSVVPSLLAYRRWGLDAPQVGLLGSATIAGMLVGALLAGGLTDRFGRRRVLLVCVTVFSVAMGLAAVAPSVGIFAIARLLIGVGTGGLMPTAAAFLIEYSPAGRRNRVAGIGFAGVAFGGLVAAVLGAILVPTFGFRIMFAIGCLPLVIVFPLLFRHLPESVGFLLARGRRAEAEEVVRRFDLPVVLGPVVLGGDGSAPEEVSGSSRRPRAAVLLSPAYRRATLLFWVATAMCLLVSFGVNTWLPTLMRTSGYALTSALSFQVALNLGAVIGAVSVVPQADRFGSKTLALTTFAAGAVSLALLSTAPPAFLGYFLVALAGVGTIGTQTLINTFVGSYYPTRLRATGLGMSLGVGRIGGIVGPTYGGFVLSLGLDTAWGFYAFVLPALLGAAAIAAVPRRAVPEPGDVGVTRLPATRSTTRSSSPHPSEGGNA